MASTRVVSLTELIVGVVLSLIGGVAIGVLGTFKHRYGMTGTPFATPLPIGLVASLILVAMVLLTLRVVLRTRLYALCAAIGIIGAIALLTLKGPGGSVVVVADAIGTWWTIAPVVIAAIVVFVPLPRRMVGRGARDGVPADGMMAAPPEGSPL